MHQKHETTRTPQDDKRREDEKENCCTTHLVDPNRISENTIHLVKKNLASKADRKQRLNCTTYHRNTISGHVILTEFSSILIKADAIQFPENVLHLRIMFLN
uniref:Uncharacterized protein n=1 Tax=Strigamia maritima TaxID=126957 RepID=T1IW15_STRMM